MRFKTYSEMACTCRALTDELQPTITFCDRTLPCQFIPGRHNARRSLPFEIGQHLQCAACLVPARTSISVKSALTETGMEGIAWLRKTYAIVTTRPQFSEGAHVDCKPTRRKRGPASKNGKGKVTH